MLFAKNTLKPRSLSNKISLWSAAFPIAIMLYNIEKNYSQLLNWIEKKMMFPVPCFKTGVPITKTAVSPDWLFEEEFAIICLRNL